MAIDTPASTLGTRSTASVSTASLMAIATKAPGTKARSRDSGCTRSEMATSNRGTGILGLSRLPCPHLILLFSVQYRLLSGPRRTPFACRESTSKSTRRSWPRTGPPRLLVWRRSRQSRTGWMANFAIPMCELLCGRPRMVVFSFFLLTVH